VKASRELYLDAIAREREWAMLQPSDAVRRSQMTLLESMPKIVPQFATTTPAEIMTLIESATRELDGHVERPRVVPPQPRVIQERREEKPVPLTTDEYVGMLQRLAGVEPVTRLATPLREAEEDKELPEGVHTRLAEALGVVIEKPVGEGVHERLAAALRRR
jgi:hypothetical protein